MKRPLVFGDQTTEKTYRPPASAYVDLSNVANAPRLPQLIDGMPFGFLAGQPDYRESLPANGAPDLPRYWGNMDATLSDAADREGERVRTGSQDSAGQSNYLGFPLAMSAPDSYDYHGELLNAGKNENRQSFVNAYDAQQRAKDRVPMRSEFGEDIPFDTSAEAFREISPKEKEARNWAGAEFAANLAASLNPYTALPFALYNTYTGARDAIDNAQSGHSREAMMNSAGALLSALGIIPGASSVAKGASGITKEVAAEAPAAVRPPYTSEDIARAISELGIAKQPEVPSSSEASPFKVGDRIQLRDKDGVSLLREPMPITDIQHSPEYGSYVQVKGSNSYYPLEGAVKADANPGTTLSAIVGLGGLRPFGPQHREMLARGREIQSRADLAAFDGTKDPDIAQAAASRLGTNAALPAADRNYYGGVADYLRPLNQEGNARANTVAEAYLQRSGGQMYQPVPMRDLNEFYRDESAWRRDQGIPSASYANAPGGLLGHLLQYGAQPEKGGFTPNKAAIWRVSDDSPDALISMEPYNPAARRIESIHDALAPNAGPKPTETLAPSLRGDRADWESRIPGYGKLAAEDQGSAKNQWYQDNRASRASGETRRPMKAQYVAGRGWYDPSTDSFKRVKPGDSGK